MYHILHDEEHKDKFKWTPLVYMNDHWTINSKYAVKAIALFTCYVKNTKKINRRVEGQYGYDFTTVSCLSTKFGRRYNSLAKYDIRKLY